MCPSRVIPRPPPHRLVLLAAVLALSACGGDGDTAGEPEEDVAALDGDAGSDGAGPPAADAAASPDGPDAAAAATLPAWFPLDVYVPQAYTIAGQMDAGAVQRIELRVEGAVEDLAARAGAGMQSHGWAEGADMGDTTAYTKGDRNVMLTVNERDDGAVRIGYQFSTL